MHFDITKIRETTGISKSELARYLRITRTTLDVWESKSDIPDHMGITIDKFMIFAGMQLPDIPVLEPEDFYNVRQFLHLAREDVAEHTGITLSQINQFEKKQITLSKVHQQVLIDFYMLVMKKKDIYYYVKKIYGDLIVFEGLIDIYCLCKEYDIKKYPDFIMHQSECNKKVIYVY